MKEEVIKLRNEVQTALNKNSEHINAEVGKLKTEFSKFQMVRSQDALTNKPKVKF